MQERQHAKVCLHRDSKVRETAVQYKRTQEPSEELSQTATRQF